MPIVQRLDPERMRDDDFITDVEFDAAHGGRPGRNESMLLPRADVLRLCALARRNRDEQRRGAARYLRRVVEHVRKTSGYANPWVPTELLLEYVNRLHPEQSVPAQRGA